MSTNGTQAEAPRLERGASVPVSALASQLTANEGFTRSLSGFWHEWDATSRTQYHWLSTVSSIAPELICRARPLPVELICRAWAETVL